MLISVAAGDAVSIDVDSVSSRPSRVRARSLRSGRAWLRAWTLRTDRDVCVLGCYVATEPWLQLGRYVATEPCACSVATQRPSRARARSLRSDRAWLVRGPMAILELVHGRFGYVRVAADGILYGCRGKTTSCHLTLEYWPRDKFWDLVSGCLILCLEMLETSVLGLGQDLGLITALGGAMTTSTYVSRIVFDLIPSRFKVRDMFSAYVTCMVLMTSFPVRPLRSSLYVEVIRRVAADGILYGLCKLAGFLKTLEYWQRHKFLDLVTGCLVLCLELLETSVLGLGQDLGLITGLGASMTTSTYVSRIGFELIPSRFKARDMFSAYVTCMVGIEHLFEDNF
ncbi:hypothetical protein DY000_02031181 [Brassica cretica]|uniref:Uncharacterized protein n=1 Tax=Brassica cretica TaxID=69181 RepID=A0ABQ7E137_BRACR|nr:hypothetical protein DY000_02031181 [Brassica cretica]